MRLLFTPSAADRDLCIYLKYGKGSKLKFLQRTHIRITCDQGTRNLRRSYHEWLKALDHTKWGAATLA